MNSRCVRDAIKMNKDGESRATTKFLVWATEWDHTLRWETMQKKHEVERGKYKESIF